MGQSELSNSPCTVQVVELAAPPDQKSNNCESSFETPVKGDKRGLSAQTRTSYRYTSQMQEDKRGFQNLEGEENLLMLTILRAFLKYIALFFPFFVKLVFYCVVIGNYYLCFGTVPKVAKIFQATLGAGK